MRSPCRECPWRRNSLPGYLGAATPEEFLAMDEQELRMPCHLTIDYERVDWQERANSAPQCAGRAIFDANRCKIPRDSSLLRLPADNDTIFSNASEFLMHHDIFEK